MPAPTRAILDGAAAPPLWAPPDAALAAAGVEGEYVVAKVRLVAMAFLLIAPTWNITHHPDEPVHRTGFAVTVAAALAALAIWALLRRGRWQPWIALASSAFDVSMVSTALVSFLVVGSPLVALNSKVTFEMYFLAIVATSLRYDARICIAVGTLAISQYATLWAYAAARFDLHDPRWIADAGPYSPVDLGTRLIILGLAVVLAVTLVQRAQRLLYLAARDRLTGLYNRVHFDRALRNAVERFGRDGQPLSLAILDVDHFKRINDEHGHVIGDRALRELADRLARSMRRTDLVARYGGEEFVILLPGTTRDAALFRLEALRRDVAAVPFQLEDGHRLTLDFSAGIAGLPVDEVATAEGLLDRADTRLLAAKRLGRARCLADDPPTPARSLTAAG